MLGFCATPVHLAFKNAIQPIEVIASLYRVPMFIDPQQLALFAGEFGRTYAPATG